MNIMLQLTFITMVDTVILIMVDSTIIIMVQAIHTATWATTDLTDITNTTLTLIPNLMLPLHCTAAIRTLLITGITIKKDMMDTTTTNMVTMDTTNMVQCHTDMVKDLNHILMGCKTMDLINIIAIWMFSPSVTS